MSNMNLGEMLLKYEVQAREKGLTISAVYLPISWCDPEDVKKLTGHTLDVSGFDLYLVDEDEPRFDFTRVDQLVESTDSSPVQ